MVLWHATRESAMAFRSNVSGQTATFTVAQGGFLDDVTGTVWAVDGSTVEGPLDRAGNSLTPLTDAYVAFWGAWAAFHPRTELALGS